MNNVLIACLAFILSIFIVLLLTSSYVVTSPQGPILFCGSIVGILVTIVAWCSE